VDETAAWIEKLIHLGRSLGPNDYPIILYRVAEAQDQVLHEQKERVERLREQASQMEKEPRVWMWHDCQS
jgi:hypothetical protein